MAWKKFLSFSADRQAIAVRPNEISNLIQQPSSDGSVKLIDVGYKIWVQRTQHLWGLMEHIRHSCRLYKVDKLLIESKASGQSAAQELQNRFGRENYAIQLVNPVGDKLARAYAAQATFAQGLVFAPAKDWSEMVITDCALFPHAKHDDIMDAVSQAIIHLRSTGLARTDDEVRADEDDCMRHQAGRYRRKALYPC